MPNILEKKNKSDQLNGSLENNQTLNDSAKPSPDQLNNPTSSEAKPQGLMTIIGQCLPFAPLLFEQVTGQKVPALTGTMADIQQSINQLATNSQQLTSSLSQVINNQQQIFQRIVKLETSASQQILSL